MVHAIDFGLLKPGIFLACFVKVVLLFLRYPLYTNKIVAFSSLIFMMLNKPLHFVLTLYLLL